MNKPSILIITTSHSDMGSPDERTGVWLEELTTPYYAFADQGAEVTLASIAGGPVPIDPRSTGDDSRKEESVRRYLDDPNLQAKVANTPAFTSLDSANYDALFLPGGHGTMWTIQRAQSWPRSSRAISARGRLSPLCAMAPPASLPRGTSMATRLSKARRSLASRTAKSRRLA
jgi:hypothetical protein